ncbi:MAG: site-2 protease family protein, partial [archaeon]
MYLYRTQIGVKFIDKFTTKYKKVLSAMQYVVITSGYVLMTLVLWLLGRLAYVYTTSPTLARDLRAPVLMPLIPYVDQIFKVDFLPPFYFTYWILIIAIIAIPHEFAHGIFARFYKIKVHSTGFGFLGPFLAAFVEPDDKQMEKKPKKAQLTVLASGTFANVIFGVLSVILLFIFVAAAFSPAGVYFNTYTYSPIALSEIDNIGALNLSSPLLTEIKVNNQTFLSYPNYISESMQKNVTHIFAYDDAPAIRSAMGGAIVFVNGVSTPSYAILNSTLSKYSPGDNILVKTISKNGTETNYNITLASREGRPLLGIGIAEQQKSRLMSWLYNVVKAIKDPAIYYTSNMGEFGDFIYNLLWWCIMINFSVALFNMVPVGLFDGGRFFYLTVLGITRNKKFAERAFAFMTYLF